MAGMAKEEASNDCTQMNTMQGDLDVCYLGVWFKDRAIR